MRDSQPVQYVQEDRLLKFEREVSKRARFARPIISRTAARSARRHDRLPFFERSFWTAYRFLNGHSGPLTTRRLPVPLGDMTAYRFLSGHCGPLTNRRPPVPSSNMTAYRFLNGRAVDGNGIFGPFNTRPFNLTARPFTVSPGSYVPEPFLH